MNTEQLREWLNRPPPHGHWRRWFEGERYLGVSSARRAPDSVDTKQPCQCVQCRPGGGT